MWAISRLWCNPFRYLRWLQERQAFGQFVRCQGRYWHLQPNKYGSVWSQYMMALLTPLTMSLKIWVKWICVIFTAATTITTTNKNVSSLYFLIKMMSNRVIKMNQVNGYSINDLIEFNCVLHTFCAVCGGKVWFVDHM